MTEPGPAPDPWATSPEWTPPPPRSRFLVLAAVLGALALPALVVVMVYLVGGLVRHDRGPRPVSTDLEDIRVGDCVREHPEENVSEVDVVPCAWAHAAEVYTTYRMPDGDYPGDAALKEEVVERCRSELGPYVGANRGETGYSIVYLRPTEDSWDGPRVVVCMLQDPEHRLLMDSAKGKGRNHFR